MNAQEKTVSDFKKDFEKIAESELTEEQLNECWTEEGSSENEIVWYENGAFSFTEINPEKTYSPCGGGFYVYQLETGEIFAQITDLDAMQVISISNPTKYAFSLKKYYSILEMTDSIVIVHTLPSEYEINRFDFHLDSKGKWQLIFTDAATDEIPFITKRYKRSKNE